MTNKKNFAALIVAFAAACDTTPARSIGGSSESAEERIVTQAATEGTSAAAAAATDTPAAEAAADAPSVDPADPAAEAIARLKKLEFQVPASARALLHGSVVGHRAPGFKFAGKKVPKLVFAKPTQDAALAKLRDIGERFFAAAGASFSVGDFRAAPVVSRGVPGIDIPGRAGIAYTVTESGAITLKSNPAGQEHETTITNDLDAVSVALAAIADNRLLTLDPNETLEVASIQYRHAAAMNETGIVSHARVAHQIAFARTYGGIPVLGPSTLVVLDSDGKIETFRKGWRDIVGESGTIALASDADVASRRDQAKVQYL